ncbi:MAG: succinate dehydrogenase, cytochrome b556 subunit [Pseudomonadota bacterium]
MSESQTTKRARPLSPHLQVYKLPYNAMMSIIGRGVGIGLSLALSVVLIWFNLAVGNAGLYNSTIEFLNLPLLGYLFLLAAFVIFFYIGNGIRHVLWDFVIGVHDKTGRMTGHIVLIVSALLTLGLWSISGQSDNVNAEPIDLGMAAEKLQGGAL